MTADGRESAIWRGEHMRGLTNAKTVSLVTGTARFSGSVRVGRSVTLVAQQTVVGVRYVVRGVVTAWFVLLHVVAPATAVPVIVPFVSSALVTRFAQIRHRRARRDRGNALPVHGAWEVVDASAPVGVVACRTRNRTLPARIRGLETGAAESGTRLGAVNVACRQVPGGTDVPDTRREDDARRCSPVMAPQAELL